jgi:uncharacterized membrane protein YfcA
MTTIAPWYWTVPAVAAIFVAAGWVKGVVGMGLPTVAMGLLGLLMPPSQAAALLVAPSLVTNLWQLVTGPSFGAIAKRLAPMMLGVCVGTACGIRFMTSGSHWPSIALGAVLALYGVIGLKRVVLTVSPRQERLAGPLVGLATGIVTGTTGLFVVPAVPYLSALGFGREEMIQALGLSFTVSTIALAACLGAVGSFDRDVLLASALAIAPALAGMYVGTVIRHRLDPERFRRWFFAFMIAIGALMVVHSAAT